MRLTAADRRKPLPRLSSEDPEARRRAAIRENQSKRAKTRPPTLPRVWRPDA